MKSCLHESLGAISQAMSDFPWKDKKRYGDYLAQTYYYVLHSTRLLALAASRIPLEEEVIYRRFLSHLREESGHELLVLRDMKELGFVIGDFEEIPSTRLFWQPQYYLIEHQDPLSLLGYILVLEALAVKECPKIAEQISQLYGGGFQFVKVHGEEDPDHVEKAVQMIATLSGERQTLIEENMRQSALAYTLMVEDVKYRKTQGKLLKVG